MEGNKDCLSKKGMMRYLRKEMSPEEFMVADVHLAGCDLCREAMVGLRSYLSNHSYEELESTLDNLNTGLSNRISNGKNLQSKWSKLPGNPFFWGIISLIGIIAIVLLIFVLKAKHESPHPVNKTFEEFPEKQTNVSLEKKVPAPAIMKEKETGNIASDKKEIKHVKAQPGQTKKDSSYSVQQKTPLKQEEQAEQVNEQIVDRKTQHEIFIIVEEQPFFPGGDEERLKFLRDNIQYPKEAQKLGVQGKVFVTFVVEQDGSLTDVRVLRGIGAGCDEEAVRVVKSMPKWIPGKQRGQPMRVQFTLPVKFALQ